MNKGWGNNAWPGGSGKQWPGYVNGLIGGGGAATHYYVNETTRLENRNTTFSGTVRNVPGTYATITAAITASTSGDIIQLADGTYDMANEPNGYLLWNAATKNILVRGNSGNSSAVTLTQTGASTFAVRLYNTAELRFENLKLTTTKNASPIYTDWNARSIYQVFVNCIIDNTNTDSGSRLYLLSDMAYSNIVNHIEFKNCHFTKSPSNSTIWSFTKTGANTQLFFDKCTFSTTTSIPLLILDGNTCNVAVYDSTFNQSTSQVCIRIGQDTAFPTQIFGLVDLRNNDIIYADGVGQHGVLLGRGTANIYCVNNRIMIPAGNTNTWIGIVVKTVSSNVNNAIVAGNISTAPRPLLLKGAAFINQQYNTCISNDTSGLFYGLEATNTNEGDGVLACTDSKAVYNNFFGKKSGIGIGTDVLTPSTATSIQDWECNHNNYFSTNGLFAYNGSDISFASKGTFWTGAPNNDLNSKMVSKNTYKISSQKKDVS